jgi:putative endonuclease
MTGRRERQHETTLRLHHGQPPNGTLYTGVTSNPPKRAFEHRDGLVKGFSKKYQCKMLVWYELHESMYDAITREKQIKPAAVRKSLP